MEPFLVCPSVIQTRFILIETSHAGNVGAVARAIKVMGFDDLVLVRPRWANVLRREETIQRASGALDVLNNARIVGTLDEALEGMTHLCATAMTARDFGPPTLTPRTHLESFIEEIRTTDALVRDGDNSPQNPHGSQAESGSRASPSPSPSPSLIIRPAQQTGVAFLFGSERFGMTNEDVYRCHVALQIPSNPQFGSLNIAAAVQLIAYEWRICLGGFDVPTAEQSKAVDTLADAGQIGGLLSHWQSALEAIGYLDPEAPKKLMPRLNQFFNRARMTIEEIHIFRGVAKAMIRASGQLNSPLESKPETVGQTLEPKEDRL